MVKEKRIKQEGHQYQNPGKLMGKQLLVITFALDASIRSETHVLLLSSRHVG